MNYEFNILYYINLFKKFWKKALIVVCVSMLATSGLPLLKRPSYISTVTFITMSEEAVTATSLTGILLGVSPTEEFSSRYIAPLLYSKRMSRDIKEHFDLDKKPGFRYRLSTSPVGGASAISVRGSDPVLVQQIADFVVQNLDKLNEELDLTPQKPMLKVLDAPDLGASEPRQIEIVRKVVVAGLLSFLLTIVSLFFSDYIKTLKAAADVQ